MFKTSQSLRLRESRSLRLVLPNLPSKGIFSTGYNGQAIVNPIIGWIHPDTGKALRTIPCKYESYDDTSKFVVDYDDYANMVTVRELSHGQTASNTVDLKHLEAIDFFVQNQWTKNHHIPSTQKEYDAWVAKKEAGKARARELVADMMAKEGVTEATADMRFAAFAATNDLCSEEDLATIFDKVEGANIRKLDQIMVDWNRDLEKYEDKQLFRRTYGQQWHDVHGTYYDNIQGYNRKAVEFAKEFDSNAEQHREKYQHDLYLQHINQMPRKGRPFPLATEDFGIDEMYPRHGETVFGALHREYLSDSQASDLYSFRIRRFMYGFMVFFAMFITYKLNGEEIPIDHDHHAEMVAEAKKNGCYTCWGIFNA